MGREVETNCEPWQSFPRAWNASLAVDGNAVAGAAGINSQGHMFVRLPASLNEGTVVVGQRLPTHLQFVAYKVNPASCHGDNTAIVIATSAGIAVVLAILFALAANSYADTRVEVAQRAASLKWRYKVEGVEHKLTEVQEENTIIKEQLKLTYKLTSNQQDQLLHSYEELHELLDPSLFTSVRDITWKSRLGAGAFGECYLGMLRGVAVAIKRFPAPRVNLANMKKITAEIILLSKMHHPHLVNLVACCVEDQVLICMEFVPNGELKDFLTTFANYEESPSADNASTTHESVLLDELLRKGDNIERILVIMASQVADGLSYLHAFHPAPIVHRDIKTENILLGEDMSCKIADLGEAR